MDNLNNYMSLTKLEEEPRKTWQKEDFLRVYVNEPIYALMPCMGEAICLPSVPSIEEPAPLTGNVSWAESRP